MSEDEPIIDEENAIEVKLRQPPFIRAVAIVPAEGGMWGLVALDLTPGHLEMNCVKAMEPDARLNALENASQHLYDWSEMYRENRL